MKIDFDANGDSVEFELTEEQKVILESLNIVKMGNQPLELSVSFKLKGVDFDGRLEENDYTP